LNPSGQFGNSKFPSLHSSFGVDIHKIHINFAFLDIPTILRLQLPKTQLTRLSLNISSDRNDLIKLSPQQDHIIPISVALRFDDWDERFCGYERFDNESTNWEQLYAYVSQQGYCKCRLEYKGTTAEARVVENDSPPAYHGFVEYEVMWIEKKTPVKDLVEKGKEWVERKLGRGGSNSEVE
jgi:hypothetical protein